jgi:hypothetical protein
MSRPEQITINAVLIVLLVANLLVFGRISAGIGHLCDRLALVSQQTAPMLAAPMQAAPAHHTATASGNVVTVESPSPTLPNGPRTVEQIALYLGVTPDTVRESYIPAWIEQGLMGESDRTRNRWLVPGTFEPVRPK